MKFKEAIIPVKEDGEKQMQRLMPMAKMTVLLLGLLAMFAIAACSKVDKESYAKIKTGMSYPAVVDVLGKPDVCEDAVLTTKNCIWGSSDKQIKIKFVGDIVAWRSSKGI